MGKSQKTPQRLDLNSSTSLAAGMNGIRKLVGDSLLSKAFSLEDAPGLASGSFTEKLRLNRIDISPNRSEVPMNNPGEMPGIEILVIDDDPSVGKLLDSFLRSKGYNPVTCKHPKEALEYSEKNRFDLAFVDINLPGMNGLELASRLKELNPLGEVVFITGYGSFDNAIQAIKMGAYDYLRKPFGISELELCIKRFQERQRLKEQVKIAEQRYFHLVQNIPSLVFIINRDFRLEFINRACEAMLGYTAEEALGDPYWFMGRIHPGDLERVKGLFLSVFQSSSSRFSAECRLLHKDGHLIHAMVRSIALTRVEEDTEINRLQGMVIDITDRVFLEKAVVQKEKLRILDSIASEVAHEIRNPLVSIGGFARRLRKSFPELPEGDIILQESQRLEKLLQRIADYLKPVEVNYQECSINRVVTDCVEMLVSEMEPEGFNYQLHLDPSLSVVSIDKDILERIFIDLIRNGEKEMGKEGTLHISTFESDRNLHIEFKNRYQRTQAEDAEPFFMPFNDGAQRIGLPISYRLLKNMGGLLSFSQRDNDMVFTVTLPKKGLSISEMDGVTAH